MSEKQKWVNKKIVWHLLKIELPFEIYNSGDVTGTYKIIQIACETNNSLTYYSKNASGILFIGILFFKTNQNFSLILVSKTKLMLK